MKTISAVCVCEMCVTLGRMALAGFPGARATFIAYQEAHVIAALASLDLAMPEESSEGYTSAWAIEMEGN